MPQKDGDSDGPVRDGRREALYMLLRLNTAIHRQGWEKGPTENEVVDEVNLFLMRNGINSRPQMRSYEEMDKRTSRLLAEYDAVYKW